MVVGFLDEVFHHLRWQDDLAGILERLVHWNHPILGQIDDIVPLEEQAISDFGDEGFEITITPNFGFAILLFFEK